MNIRMLLVSDIYCGQTVNLELLGLSVAFRGVHSQTIGFANSVKLQSQLSYTSYPIYDWFQSEQLDYNRSGDRISNLKYSDMLTILSLLPLEIILSIIHIMKSQTFLENTTIPFLEHLMFLSRELCKISYIVKDKKLFSYIFQMFQCHQNILY